MTHKTSFTLDESSLGTLPKTPPREIELVNRAGTPVESIAIAEDLSRIPGVAGVKSLTVGPTSQVRDLAFLVAIPQVVDLQIFGPKIRVLDGLEKAPKLKYLEIRTGPNKKRDLVALAATTATDVLLKWARKQDTTALATCRRLRRLTLIGCKELSIVGWSKVPLRSLTLSASSLKQFGDTGALARMQSLHVQRCTKLANFVGDNSVVRSLIVDACNSLSLETIRTFSNLVNLSIIGNRRPIELVALSGLTGLKTLLVQGGSTSTKRFDLKRDLPALESLTVDRLSDAETETLKVQKVDIAITTTR